MGLPTEMAFVTDAQAARVIQLTGGLPGCTYVRYPKVPRDALSFTFDGKRYIVFSDGSYRTYGKVDE